MRQLKTTILFLLILVSSTATLAQDYDLNTYDFRYQKYRGLTTGFDLGSRGGQSFSSQQDTMLKDSFYDNSGGVTSSFRFSPNYFSLINTDDLQRTTNISGYISLQGSRSAANSSFGEAKNKSLYNGANLRYQSYSRYYTGNNFTYLGVYSFTNLESDRRASNDKRYNIIPINYYDFENSRLRIYNSNSVSYGFGKGRLNNVTDAVQAIFILQDLQLMDGTSYSNKQIEEIAKGITSIRNARYLDYRLGYKTQLTLLDSVLRANGVSSEKSANYFTTISDNWLYGNRLSRVSGAEWTNYITLSNSINHIVVDNKASISNPNRYNRNNEIIPSLSLNTSYIVSTQKSYYVEMHKGFTISSGVEYISEKGEETFSDEPLNVDSLFQEYKDKKRRNTMLWNTEVSASWGFIYQPNTRNYFRAYLSPSVLFSKHLPKLINDKNIDIFRYNVNPDFRAGASYYHWFSPQMNISFNADVSTTNRFDQVRSEYIFTKRQNTNLNYDFSAKLVYQFY